MASRDSDFKLRQSIICGFLRNVINDQNDYSFIFTIITSFYHQGFAKYFDETIDKNYEQNMRFGDILKTEDHNFMIIDIDNQLTNVGKFFGPLLWINVPFTICNHLYNAVLFYSKVSQNKVVCDSVFSLDVKHNDQWILQHFDGPLDPQYKSIKIEFIGQKFDVHISPIQGYSRSFHLNHIKSRDIINYFEIRKDSKNLVKLRAEFKHSSSLNIVPCKAVSALWEMSSTCGYIDLDTHLCVTHFFLIGPIYEQTKMINKLKKIYKGFDLRISNVEPKAGSDYMPSS